MESASRRRLRECGIPLDMNAPMQAFAIGPGRNACGPPHLIPREKWEEEAAAKGAEESEFWEGHAVPIDLMVELPFWLTIPDCELSVVYGETNVRARIRGQYMAVSDGPLFLASRSNFVFIGPRDDLDAGEQLPEPVKRVRAPVFHPMKTVVIFRPEAKEDAIQPLRESPADPEDTVVIRRMNRSFQYLQSLAYAHIPVLNALILSYRLASRDPFAFRIAPWDVPTWFIQHNGELLRVCLMPYHDNDEYPATRSFATGERSLFSSATPQAVDAKAIADMAPGIEEILDAQSLFYRGHLDDAVRSAVTAIEVAIEGQIAKLLGSQGCTIEQIESRLKETWKDFDERVLDYERISGTRIPGPILSPIPYINGIRLKSELGWVRRLRHKIVHEGLRVDSRSRGMMLRAIETMTWLFYWLTWSEGDAEDHSASYVFFEAMRGLQVPRYLPAYRESSIEVLSDQNVYGKPNASEDILWSQYHSTIEEKTSDVELFALMSFNYLEVDIDDAPPPVDDSVLVERFIFNESGCCTRVFCVESDRLVNCETIEAVSSRLRDLKQTHGASSSALCIIHHQKSVEVSRRAAQGAISDDVNRLGQRYGITLITSLDLRVLVQGVLEYHWKRNAVKEMLHRPGRQGVMPPAHKKIGQANRIFPKCSVISIELDSQEVLNVGDTIGLRLPARFFEQKAMSMQIGGETVSKAVGPCRVGVITELKKSDVKEGQTIYLRIE